MRRNGVVLAAKEVIGTGWGRVSGVMGGAPSDGCSLAPPYRGPGTTRSARAGRTAPQRGAERAEQRGALERGAVERCPSASSVRSGVELQRGAGAAPSVPSVVSPPHKRPG